MPRSRTALVLAVPLAAGLSACGSAEPTDSGAGPSAGTVVTEFYPLQFVAERIAGDDLEVINLAPPGVEPHDLELSPSQVASIAEADLVVYLGEFAPAIDEAVEQNADGRGLDVATVVELIPGAADEHGHAGEDEHAEDGDHADGESEEDEHGGLDPHFWLDPSLLGTTARSVADRMGEVDPDRADTYAERAADLVAELDDLDTEYRDGLVDCSSHVIVTAHSAFGYLAARYGLEQYSVAGLEPDAEPSAARIAEVHEVIEHDGVTTVYFEPLTSSDVVDAIADDLGIETAELDPIESIGAQGDADYFSAMRHNLESLRSGLGCS